MSEASSGFSGETTQATKKTGGEDLSDEIIRTVEKRPGDYVRCTRVAANSYRCNWWSPEGTTGYDNPAMSALMVTTHRVRKSRFLNVTKTAAGLVIKELPSTVTAE